MCFYSSYIFRIYALKCADHQDANVCRDTSVQTITGAVSFLGQMRTIFSELRKKKNWHELCRSSQYAAEGVSRAEQAALNDGRVQRLFEYVEDISKIWAGAHNGHKKVCVTTSAADYWSRREKTEQAVQKRILLQSNSRAPTAARTPSKFIYCRGIFGERLRSLDFMDWS